MPNLGSGPLGLDVSQQPQYPGHRPRHRDLARAEQRDVGQPHQARCIRGELGSEVRRRGEDDADQVTRVDVVARERLANELLGTVENGIPLVCLDLDRPTNRTHRHCI
jgi:hypothetical protein